MPSPIRADRRRPERLLCRLTVTVLAVGLLGTAAPASADHGDLAPGRKAVRHTVQPGDTATGLAVRHHAWTRELISLNHLGPDATLRVGQRITIPVVRSAVAADRRAKRPDRADRSDRDERADRGRAKQRRQPKARRPATPIARERARVRGVIARTARQHGVDPQLALAVSWQEAGWRMHHVSSANAIGAMQVLPGTGQWMELYADRSLDLGNTRDNALAGVLLLGVLDEMTGSRDHRIGAYYQGIGAVRRHGLFPETRVYVANVLAIKARLERGLPPA